MKKLLWVVLFWTSLATAQVVGPGFVDYVTSAPSGACSQGQHQQNVLGNGQVWTCQSGTWAQVSGGGSGTVSSGILGEPAIYTVSGSTVGASNQTVDASAFPGANWFAQALAAATAIGNSGTVLIPPSLASVAAYPSGSVPSGITLWFTGTGTYGVGTISAGKFSKFYAPFGAVLQMDSAGSGQTALSYTGAGADLQSTDRPIFDGLRIDCNSQTSSTGMNLTASSGNALFGLDNLTISGCTTVGAFLGGIQFSDISNLHLTANYVNLKFYSTAGGSSNTFYNLISAGPTSGVGVIFKNTSTTQQMTGNICVNCQFQNGTIAALAVIGNSTTGNSSSQLILNGGSPELNGGGAASVTIDGVVIPQSGFLYSTYAAVNSSNLDMEDGTANPECNLANNSIFTLNSPWGYGVSGGVACKNDGTSYAYVNGTQTTTGEWHGLLNYPVLFSTAVLGIREDGAPLLTLNSSFPNGFTGNPLTPAVSSAGTGASNSTATDPVYGLVTTGTYAASAGNASSTNNIKFNNLVASPLGVTEDLYLSFLMESSVNVGTIGSCDTTGFKIYGGGSNFSDLELCLTAGQWTRVVVYLPNQTASTNISLIAYPQDSSGPTISFTGFEALSEPAQSQQSLQLIGMANQMGYVNPNNFGGTGTGPSVRQTSPTLVTPLLGTPTSGVLTNETGYLWNNLANPGGNLALSNGTNTTILSGTAATAQFFALKNTTAAVIGTSQGSEVLALCGRAFHGSADVEDCMTFSELPGNGNDAAIAQAIGHTGTSTGTVTLATPLLLAASGNGTNPGYGFSSATNTGMYNGTGLEFTVGGANAAAMRGSGSGITIPAAGTWGFSSTSDPAAGQDTGLSRLAAAVVAIGNGTANDTTAKVKAAAYMSVGTKFTQDTGCGTIVTSSGGATAGKFTTVGSTSCTTVVTMGNGATAPTGWSCNVKDLTTVGDITNPKATSSTATTVTIVSGTIVSGDVIEFSCIGY